jgi:imidazole glycerol-phosphate synthase subunit HisH
LPKRRTRRTNTVTVESPCVAIVDYGMGNLFSVRQACHIVGLNANITENFKDIQTADGIILPGVGAFGKAMEEMNKNNLVSIIREQVSSGKPILGICLGQQLLMSESFEFGCHEGLNLVKGDVIRFDHPSDVDGQELKVPHIGWNRIYREESCAKTDIFHFSGLADGVYMYFVHSFYVRPQELLVKQLYSRYGDIEFCSGFQKGNIFACQFHPERSADSGIHIYKNFAKIIDNYLSHGGAHNGI